MLKYTVQFYISGYANPEGTIVEHYNSLSAIKAALQSEHDRAEQYGAGYEPSEAIIWIGCYDDVTDLYPDKQAIMGSRGGVTIQSC